MNTSVACVAVVLATLAAPALAQSNINAVNKFSWSENCGWMNWRDAGAPAGAEGVRFVYTYLSGFAWSENTGSINFGQGPADGIAYVNATGLDFGVNHDQATGHLSGYAWGENIGWINFSGGALATPANPARIDLASPRRLRGYAWGENVGWINLDVEVEGQFVQVNPCRLDYNLDAVVNSDDLGDFITDYYTDPAISGPGGYAIACPENEGPYDVGYKAAYTPDGSGQCTPPFPDNLGDFITDYYGVGC